MKKLIIALSATALTVSSCDFLHEASKTVVDATSTTTSTQPSLTEQEVVKGLKEALTIGITDAVDLTSITDGFYGNSNIRLPFPQDAIAVKEKAIEWGLEGKVNQFEETLNRAAEEASKEALPIFKSAITSMTIQDAFGILNGGDGAATNYLKKTTTAQLTEAFSPKVKDAIEKVQLTKYWEPIIKKYNTFQKFNGGEEINEDLNAYVTEKAIDGLFYMVAQEENKIRKDPAARVTDILQKVFGSITN